MPCSQGRSVAWWSGADNDGCRGGHRADRTNNYCCLHWSSYPSRSVRKTEALTVPTTTADLYAQMLALVSQREIDVVKAIVDSDSNDSVGPKRSRALSSSWYRRSRRSLRAPRLLSTGVSPRSEATFT